MDVSAPHRALAPSLDLDVLVVLARTDAPLTGLQVARLVSRGSPSGVKQALHRLVDQGLVIRDPAGSAYLHTLNRRHLAAPAVEVLAGLRAELISRMRELIGAWSLPPVHASLFGSTARGTGTTESDVDLFVVGTGPAVDDPRWEAQLDGLREAVAAWTGNDVQLLSMSENDLRELRVDGSELLQRIREEAVDLAGEPARSIASERRR